MNQKQMKTIILLLTISCLFILTASAADTTCKDHPAYVKAKGLINNIIQQNTQAAEKGKKLLQTFEVGSGTNQTASDLGVCSQYANQKSCCTKNLIKLIDTAAILKTKPLQQLKNAFEKVIAVYNNKLNKQKCTGAVTASVATMYNDDSLTNLKSLRNTQKQCKIDFGKAIAALTRGTMCSICAGVEKVSDYFTSDGKLIISADGQQQFQDATDKAITCIATSVSADNIGKVIDDLNGKYGGSDSTCQSNVKTAVLAVFANPKVTNDDGNNGKKCSGKNIFTPSTTCESSIGGDSSIDQSMRLLRAENEAIFRMLQASEDAVVGSGGVQTYVPSPLDSQVDDTGSFNPDFSSVDENNSQKLIFCALIGLFSLLL